MSFRFRPDRGLNRELKRQPRFRAALKVHAERVKDATERIAPRGPTGDYRNSIRVSETAEGPSVGSDDFAAHLVEWGSVNNPPYAPLRRGVRAAGLDMKDSSK